MDQTVAVLLEIVKITVPALVVFFTVYWLFKKFIEGQYHMEMLKFQQSQGKRSFPVKLKAFERLTLMLDRMSVPQLLLRLRNSKMSGEDLQDALIIAVQKEYEHNVAQQVYISDKLWEIIKLAKDEVLHLISRAGDQANKSSTAADFSASLMDLYRKQQVDPVQTALSAIKKEAKLLL